ncbi:nuclear transport factor 2 family protein [Streptomyces sp. NBC_01615]|uniref:nuclear transport factor 2 family protein n=1 Tax=Streptomyces sp. NBC_01615 TaxID=2975898 RepID=UPI0038662645
MSDTAELTAEQKIQKVLDIHEVQNVMSRHAYYHGLGKNAEELEAIWVKETPEPTFAQNQGYYVGYESIAYYYGELNRIMQRANLKLLRQHYPELAESDDNLGAGNLIMHPLTTPIIEIAGDGETAKGMWYSPGQVTEVMPPDYKPVANWIWEKYGVDLVREGGHWKIWHMHVYTDFFTPVGASWADRTADAPMGVGGPAVELPRPDVEEETYKVYSHTQLPQDLPRMPEPYRTFSETFSY